MPQITVRYAPIAATKNAPKLDYDAANAALERLIRAKLEGRHDDHDVNLEPAARLDVRLSADIAKIKGLKGSIFELVGEAYEEFDPADYAHD